MNKKSFEELIETSKEIRLGLDRLRELIEDGPENKKLEEAFNPYTSKFSIAFDDMVNLKKGKSEVK